LDAIVKAAVAVQEVLYATKKMANFDRETMISIKLLY
jgi:hypothetical protein